MTNLARVHKNSSTGVHTLQHYKNKGYRIHCNLNQLEKLSGVKVKKEYLSMFTAEDNTAYLSDSYETLEEGKEAIIHFYTKITGVQFYWNPDEV